MPRRPRTPPQRRQVRPHEAAHHHAAQPSSSTRTPSQIVSAEDASGGFGIQPHHADFLTTLSVGVVSWRSSRRCTALLRRPRRRADRRRRRRTWPLQPATLIPGDDLATLDQTILNRFGADAEAERCRPCRQHQAAVARHSRDGAPSSARRRGCPDEPRPDEDPLVAGAKAARRAHASRFWLQRWRTKRSPIRRLGQIGRARLDRGHADVDRHIRRPLAGRAVPFRPASGPRRC